MFVDTLWPDFGRQEFLECARANSSQRERRFGAVPEAVA